MSHIYFIHKEDVPAYLEYINASKPYQEEREAIMFNVKSHGDMERAEKSLNDLYNKYEYLHLDYKKIRTIHFSDPDYSKARDIGYVGFYRGFRWDSE